MAPPGPGDLAEAREESAMRTSPWHSIKQSVHHDNTDCNTGNNIEWENRRPGNGGKPAVPRVCVARLTPQ